MQAATQSEACGSRGHGGLARAHRAQFATARSIEDLIAKTEQCHRLVGPYRHLHQRSHEAERNTTQPFREITQLGYAAG